MKKIIFGLVFLLLFQSSGIAAPAPSGSNTSFINAGLNYFQYFNQQFSLDNNGIKLSPAIFLNLNNDKQSPIWAAFLLGGAPSSTSQQSAALRLMLPADTELRLEMEKPFFDKNSTCFLDVSGLADTLPLKANPAYSNSQSVFTPIFSAVGIGAFYDFLIGQSSGVSFIRAGADIRWTHDLGQGGFLNTLFPNSSDIEDNFYSCIWGAVQFNANEAINLEFYSYVNGSMGLYAYNGPNRIGSNNFFNSGALSIQFVQNLDITPSAPTPTPTTAGTGTPGSGQEATVTPTPSPDQNTGTPITITPFLVRLKTHWLEYQNQLKNNPDSNQTNGSEYQSLMNEINDLKGKELNDQQRQQLEQIQNDIEKAKTDQ